MPKGTSAPYCLWNNAPSLSGSLSLSLRKQKRMSYTFSSFLVSFLFLLMSFSNHPRPVLYDAIVRVETITFVCMWFDPICDYRIRVHCGHFVCSLCILPFYLSLCHPLPPKPRSIICLSRFRWLVFIVLHSFRHRLFFYLYPRPTPQLIVYRCGYIYTVCRRVWEKRRVAWDARCEREPYISLYGFGVCLFISCECEWVSEFCMWELVFGRRA